jgi:hypothetical protein
MANFKNITSTICGANDNLNGILTELDSYQDNLINQLESNVDATALKSAVEGNLSGLENKVKGLIPELPSIPDLGLQDELSALKGFAEGGLAGGQEYLSKLASLKTSFPDVDVDSLLSGAPCDAPNITLPSGGSPATNSDNLKLAKDVSDEEASYLNAQAKLDFIKNKQATNNQLAKDAQNINLGHMSDGDKQADTYKWLGHRQNLRSAGYSEAQINARLPQPNSGPMDSLTAQTVKNFETRAQAETITGDYQG